MSVKEHLKDWTDTDGAAYRLAISLGLMTEDTKFHTDAKSVFWVNNPIGNALYDTLFLFVDLGVIEINEERDKVRWNSDFIGYWEKCERCGGSSGYYQRDPFLFEIEDDKTKYLLCDKCADERAADI